MDEIFGDYFISGRAAEADCPALSEDDREIPDMVIEELGGMTRKEIVAFMHKEQVYTENPPGVQFKYAENLRI